MRISTPGIESAATESSAPKIENLRQGIAGGFGGLSKSRLRLLETKRPSKDFGGYLETIIHE